MPVGYAKMVIVVPNRRKDDTGLIGCHAQHCFGLGITTNNRLNPSIRDRIPSIRGQIPSIRDRIPSIRDSVNL